MLMAWGPFRFTIPTYSVETLRRSQKPRVEAQPVIGAAPPLHRLGPSNEEVTLQSTFYPRHFNGRGLEQLDAVRTAVDQLLPLPLVQYNGTVPNIFGTWIATDLENEETLYDPAGVPQQVNVTMTLLQEGGEFAAARAIALAAVANLGNFSLSLRLGF